LKKIIFILIKCGVLVTESFIVEKNFSKASEYYHLNALTQKKTAEHLLDIIKSNSIERKSLSILEMGCGTGFLSSGLFSSFPNAQFTISDLSEKMLYASKLNTQSLREQLKINAQFIQLNIETDPLPDSYDIITASLAFQWVEDLDKLLEKLKFFLKPNGFLCFSTLTNETFKKLKIIFQNENIPYPGPQLLTEQNITEICLKYFSNPYFHKEALFEEFENLKECLRHINHTGAGNATGAYLSPGKLKKILNLCNHKIDINYDVLYASMQK
jgi:malonyl-CoA O-methyltransferase